MLIQEVKMITKSNVKQDKISKEEIEAIRNKRDKIIKSDKTVKK